MERKSHRLKEKHVLCGDQLGSTSSCKEDWFVGILLGALHFSLVKIVYQYVPEPYMDEVFHIRQTRRYCTGDWSWDPMITTPPALYILSLPFCVGYERYVNSALFVLLFPGLCRFRRIFNKSDIMMSSLSTCLLPVLLHSSLLFYTDLLSLVCVVWGFTIASHSASATIFLVACVTRQTNIIWAGLYALVKIYHRFNAKRPIYSVASCVLTLWPFVVLAISFVVFVFVNGGIVLGDASAHHPRLHLSQFLYLIAFCAAHAWPQAFPILSHLLKKSLRFYAVLLLIMFVLCVKYGTYDHPYLLADNRHVPFYLWRWILSDVSKRYGLIPIYVLSFLFLTSSSRVPFVIRSAFIACCIAVVVPAHLIEPRYFIIPFCLWRLTATTNILASFFEVFSQLLVFAIVLFLFLFKPFQWENEPGINQRFMW